MRHLQSLKLVIVTALLALSVSACATSRSVIPVAAPVGEQPNSGYFAKITEVRDLRHFTVNPNDPSLPSLGNPEEIQDAKLTSRAVARKRNGYGMALGDVTVAEDNSVVALVRNSVKKALQDRGYAVVDEGSPDYARALPLTVDIEQFWAWMQPGFTSLTFTFNSTIGLKGSGLLVTDPTSVKSQTVVNSAFGTESTWTKTIQSGVNEMTEKLKAQIWSAGAAPMASGTDGATPPITVPGS